MVYGSNVCCFVVTLNFDMIYTCELITFFLLESEDFPKFVRASDSSDF